MTRPTPLPLKRHRCFRALVLVMLALLLGCKARDADSPVSMQGEASKPGSFLAYEHELRVQSPDPGARLDAARSACVDEQFGACSVLKIDLQRGDETTQATLVLRLAPEAVEGLIGVTSLGGQIQSRTTSAEDLADAVADNAQQLQEVTSIQARLEALQARPDLSVADVLTLTRELASLDAQRVDLQRTAVQQRRRIETNLLTLQLDNASAPSTFGAIGDAFGNGLDSLTEGTAETVGMIAYGLPFLILAFVVALIWRFLWRRLTGAGRKLD
jgi:hypothetical protein